MNTLAQLHARYWQAMLCIRHKARQLRRADFLASEKLNTLAWHLNICGVALEYAERLGDPGVALEWSQEFCEEATHQHQLRGTHHTHRVCAIYRALSWDISRLQKMSS